MTLIVGWLACDQRGPCSAYIASDSRISDKIIGTFMIIAKRHLH